MICLSMNCSKSSKINKNADETNLVHKKDKIKYDKELSLKEKILIPAIDSSYVHLNKDTLLESNFKVGVILGEKEDFSSQSVSIFMDNEDHDNDHTHSGWNGEIKYDSRGNITFRFIKVDGRKFKPLSSGENYAVLMLSGYKPPGAVLFSRYFDNEDHHNINRYSTEPPGGSISPNISNRNTTLYFCLFTKLTNVETMDDFPDFGISYGVFASQDFSKAINTGHIHIDDEDTNNENHYDFYYDSRDDIDKWKSVLRAYDPYADLGSDWQTYYVAKEFIRPIFPGDYYYRNTDMYPVKVK